MALPTPMEVTKPLASTVATSGLFDSQVTPWMDGVSCTVSPRIKSFLSPAALMVIFSWTWDVFSPPPPPPPPQAVTLRLKSMPNTTRGRNNLPFFIFKKSFLLNRYVESVIKKPKMI